MHILLLGGTGQSGIDFARDALKTGHRLTLYVRSPSKLPNDVVDSINVTVVEGDFNNTDAIKQALSHRAEVLVSFVGPAMPHKGTPITEFYEQLFPLLKTHGSIRRCVILSTASYHAPEDRTSIKWFFGILLVRFFLGSAYQEITGMSQAAVTLLPDEIEWTLFRVPGLNNGEAKPVRAGFIGYGKADGIFLSRKSIGPWILQELEERQWIRKAPCICNPGWI